MLVRVEGVPYEALAASVRWRWSGFGELLAALETLGTGLNIGLLAGHSTIRRFVMGERAVSSVATESELTAMEGALADGAIDFSTSQAATQTRPLWALCSRPPAWWITSTCENAAGHDRPERTASALFYDDVNDRPGSPGAEANACRDPANRCPG
jgi:hypothetical protein